MNKYIFETDENREMNIVTNRHKLISALYELSRWRRELYKEYDNNIKYYCNGKLYEAIDLHQDNDIPKDEHGLIKGCQSVYLVQDIINQIDDILYDVKDIIDD